MCKVSVIIPVYNAEKYLAKCLDSVINQTLKEIEIICIDDGSTDGSSEILNKYSEKDKRLVVISQNNLGLSAARNNALSVAKGEYIGFVDSDDWLSENFYQDLYDTAIKYKTDIAVGNILRVYREEKQNYYYVKYKKIKKVHKVKDKYKLAGIPDNCYVWNKIYKRDKLVRLGLNFEEGVLYEDILFTHKALFYMKDVVSVPSVTYYYYDNLLSIVNVDTEDSIADRNRMYIKAMNFIQDNNINYEKYYKRYKWDKKVTYSILGIPILIIRKYCSYKYYYLFGCINILSIKVNDRTKF